MECCDVDNKQYSKVISLILPEVYLYIYVLEGNIAHLFIFIIILLLFKIKYVDTYCNTIQMLNSILHQGRPAGGNMRQSNY